MAISTWYCAVGPDPAAYGPYCSQNRYGVLQAGFIPFAMGGLFYFHRRALRAWIKTNWLALIVLLIAGHAAMFFSTALTATIGPYLGIGVMFCLLAVWKEETATRTQDFFGRASYHLFIGHMPIAAVLVTGLGLRAESIFVFLATSVVALGLSTGLVPIEHSINLVRQRISSSVPKGEIHGHAAPQVRIGQPSTPQV